MSPLTGQRDVSVVIPHHRGFSHLRQCLTSVIRQGGYREILLVDDASTDGSSSEAKKIFPEIQILRNQENRGFSGSVDRGVREAKGRFTVILNDDAEVQEGWLPPLIDMLESDSSIAACQPKILSKSDPSLFEYGGAAGGYLDRFGYPFCRGRLFWTLEKDEGQYDSPVELFWASGTAFAVKRDLFIEAGGFDEDFFAHMEEIDLCWRFQQLGYRIRFVPGSVVHHQGGATLPYGDFRKNYLNHRNNLAMVLKNAPFPQFLFLLGIRLFLEGLEFLYWIVRGDLQKSKGIIQALFWNLIHLGETLRKRKTLSPKEHHLLPATVPVYPGSVVIDYFFQGKKTFNGLRWKPSRPE